MELDLKGVMTPFYECHFWAWRRWGTHYKLLEGGPVLCRPNQDGLVSLIVNHR
jgi:hypothetical protein